MIDVTSESLICLKEVPSVLPSRRGKPLTYGTVHRWATDGCRGRTLDTCWIGGIRYTSREAISRFLSHESDDARQPARRPS